MTLSSVFSALDTQRSKKIASTLSPLLAGYTKVLDFGCGSMQVADALTSQNSALQLMGIDVLDLQPRPTNFTPYDGKHIPFPDRSFEVTFAVFVLHHTTDIPAVLQECKRVTTKRLILFEDTYQNVLEHAAALVCDQGNRLLAADMPLPLNFLSVSQWLGELEKLKPAAIKMLPYHPFFLKPTRHIIFVVDF